MPRNNSTGSNGRLLTLAVLVAVIAALAVARDVLIPFTLSALISFLLAPVVARLERWGLWRVPAVMLVALVTFVGVGVLMWVVWGQVVDLAEQLPLYERNIRHKVDSLQGQGLSLTKVAQRIQEISDHWADTQPATAPASAPATLASTPAAPTLTPPAPPPTTSQPMPVRMIAPNLTPLELMRDYVSPLLAPAGTAGIVMIFVVFMLIQREDMRDRIIRLTGTGHIYLTTRALDDATYRISRYLLVQLALNACYGVPIGIGLYLIGIPNALLWGLLGTLLRFIPYVGIWIAAAIPITLSLALFDTWWQPVTTLSMFLVFEAIVSNTLEPWLYGRTTGVSSIAVLVAAIFWTWLWGPIGLLLATPLTVCLVVLGKHVPPLEFLSIMLGDEPALAPGQRFYQRLLALDLEEASDLAEQRLEQSSLLQVYDSVLLPAMRLAKWDAHTGQLDPARHETLRQNMLEIAEALRDSEDELAAGKAPDVGSSKAVRTPPAPAQPAPAQSLPVLCLPARDDADQLAAHLLSLLLVRRGFNAQALSTDRLASEMIEQAQATGPCVVCISDLPPSALTHTRYLCKKLRTRFPHIHILVGLWDFKGDMDRIKKRALSAGADQVVSQLGEAVDRITSMSMTGAVREASAQGPPKP